jgi:hypothetical protein
MPAKRAGVEKIALLGRDCNPIATYSFSPVIRYVLDGESIPAIDAIERGVAFKYVKADAPL